MIINYLAQDRPDILFATKGMVTGMFPPNTMAWEMAKRCGRYSSREWCRDSRRTIQLTPSTMQGAGRTGRPTTGIAAYHGKHVIKAASTTQTVIALSSGESEFYGVVCVKPQRWARRA